MTDIEINALIIANKYLPNINIEKMIKKLGEEVAELALGIGKDDKININEEIGDCAYILLHILSKTNPDKSLLDCIKEASLKMDYRFNTGYYDK